MSKLQITLDGRTFEIELPALPKADVETPVQVNGETVRVRLPAHNIVASQPEWIVIGDRPYEILFDRELKHLYARGQSYALHVRDMETTSARPPSGDGRVKAPIPGIITQIFVQPGDTVTLGQPLLILEAMKMENQIRAPRDGIVASLGVNAGSSVVLEQLLAEIA